MDIFYKVFPNISASDDYLLDFRPDYYERTILENEIVLVTAGIIADKTWCAPASLNTLAKHIEECHLKRVKQLGAPEV